MGDGGEVGLGEGLDGDDGLGPFCREVHGRWLGFLRRREKGEVVHGYL